jgi:hypothetical protein
MAMGGMVVFDREMWAIGLALPVGITKRETLQMHEEKTVAVFSD